MEPCRCGGGQKPPFAALFGNREPAKAVGAGDTRFP